MSEMITPNEPSSQYEIQIKGYGWKDLLTDAAIVAVFSGILLIVVGSFPDLFEKFLSFFK